MYKPRFPEIFSMQHRGDVHPPFQSIPLQLLGHYLRRHRLPHAKMVSGTWPKGAPQSVKSGEGEIPRGDRD